jgi:signal transduction histidine kinase
MAAAGTMGWRLAATAARLDPVWLLPVAVAGGLLAARAALATGGDTGEIATDLAVSWAFAVAAVVALARPSLRRCGIIMAALAAAWSLPELELSESGAAWTSGMLLEAVWGALLVLLVLSFPQGRLESRTARAVAVTAWVAALALPLLRLFWETDPRDTLAIGHDQGLADRVGQAGDALWLAVVLAVLTLVIRRMLSLRGTARRIGLPFLVASVAAAVLTPVWLGISAATDGALADRLRLVDRGLTLLVPLGFFAGLAWLRLRRSDASSLVVELRSGGAPSLQAQLARALGDPTVEVYYRRESGGWVDGEGRPAQLPTGGPRAVTQVVSGGEPLAALVHDPALLEDPDLVESVRATAALVLENERLAAEVRAQLAEVRASRTRIVQAADEERRRLERDLHDGAQQRLVGLALQLRLAQDQTRDPESLAALQQAGVELEETMADLREFARGVHPTLLREDGLDAAVEALARRAPLPVSVYGTAGGRLPAAVELTSYFFVSEALTNVAKHAAASAADVHVDRSNGVLRVAVSDNGVGGAEQGRGSGLAGLSDRLAAVGGTLHVRSEAHEGTTIVAEIPCDS